MSDKQLVEKIAKKDLSLSIGEDYLAFKIVDFCKNRNGASKFNVQALLSLQIPSRAKIFASETAVAVNPAQHGLQKGKKYCSDTTFVTGIRFLGPIGEVFEAMKYYQDSKGYLLSAFGTSRYEYDLGATHYQPGAGNASQGGCCTGLHWYSCAEDAVKNYANVNPIDTVVSKRLTEPRGLVLDVPQQNCNETVDLIVNAGKPSSSSSTSTSLKDVAQIRANVNRHDAVQVGDRVHYFIEFVDNLVAAVAQQAKKSPSTSSSSMIDPQAECPICLDIGSVDAPLVALSCHAGHFFHEKCVVNHTHCPLCRQPINKN